jgi:membrane protein required for colicin V production
MHWIDLLIVALIAWTTFAAFRAGFIREIIPLFAVILGAIIASRFYDDLAADIEFLIDHEPTRKFIAFVAIFIGIVVIGQIASMLLRTTATLLMLGPLDHVGGAVVGLLKGILIVEVLVFAATSFPFADGVLDAMNESALAPFFIEQLPAVRVLMPDEIQDALDRFELGLSPIVTPTPVPTLEPTPTPTPEATPAA